MLKNILGQILGSIANASGTNASSGTHVQGQGAAPGGRVFVVRNRLGNMDALELHGPPSNWDRGAIVDWSRDCDELYGFSGDPDGDGIEDWKGTGWACGFHAADAGDAVERARTGNFSMLRPWFPRQT